MVIKSLVIKMGAFNSDMGLMMSMQLFCQQSGKRSFNSVSCYGVKIMNCVDGISQTEEIHQTKLYPSKLQI